MRTGSRGAGALLLAMLTCAACANGAPPSRKLFDRFLAASNDHDLETIGAMTANDIVWRLGPWTLNGRDQAMSLHYADLINHTTLQARDVVVRGDTVECTLIERNDATRAYGPDSLVHHVRYVFRNGMVTLKEAWKRDTSIAELNRHSEPFRAWVRATHPEALAVILDSTGAPRFTRDAVQEQHQMLERWIAAGKPGLQQR
jgi:ketosteroid isomerase-like protein